MKYKDQNNDEYKAQHRKSYMKRRETHKANARKWNHEHREEVRERNRQWRVENPEKHRECIRKYKSRDVNSAGVTKHRIRFDSRYILSKNHAKLSGYEIHHCFGYGDPNRFIYIPKQLHQKIHQLLRDNNLSADSDHWNAIRDLVNGYEEYTYIRT